MKLNKIADLAKKQIDKRGGMDALKQDLEEVKQAAAGRGSIKDKARAAADAIKTPGRADAGRAPQAGPTPQSGHVSHDRPPEPPPAA